MIRWTWLLGCYMPDDARTRVCAWLRANGFDPNRVPIDSWCAHDSETDEFVVEYYERPWRLVGGEHRTPARIRVRRRRQAWLDFEAVS